MFVGMTSRGWGSTGKAPYALQRLVWTGKVPFEAHRIEARPDGFEITFTAPVDRATAADPASYAVNGFTYKYHHIYGSPTINQQTHPVRYVAVSPDGRSARLVVDGLRLGYIHEIRMGGERAAAGGGELGEQRAPGVGGVAVAVQEDERRAVTLQLEHPRPEAVDHHPVLEQRLHRPRSPGFRCPESSRGRLSPAGG